MNEQALVLKQMAQMNKMAFDNSYNMMMSAFEQNKLMLNTFLSQPSAIPEEGKKAIEDWLKNYKEGCEGLKKMADEGYAMINKYMSEGVK
jgi:predicted outer membrane protein